MAKPEGQWYKARVECEGPVVKVFFQDKLLYSEKCPELQPGLVGVCASQSRVLVRKATLEGRPTRLGRAWQPH